MTFQMLIALFTRKATLLQILGDFEKVKTQLREFAEQKEFEKAGLEAELKNVSSEIERAEKTLNNFKALVGDDD